MRIKTIDLYVTNQSRALEFYRDRLGMIVKEDEQYDAETRWISVVSPDDLDGVELLLQPTSVEDGSADFQQRRYAAGTPALSIEVADLSLAHQDLAARGVRFTMLPSAQPYGGIDAVIDDGCGNVINLHQAAST